MLMSVNGNTFIHLETGVFIVKDAEIKKGGIRPP